MISTTGHQDNHAGNTAIEDVIYVEWNVVFRELFFQSEKAGGAYNSVFWNSTKDQVDHTLTLLKCKYKLKYLSYLYQTTMSKQHF